MLCIDGVTGVGKTTQINMYRNLLKSKGIDYKIFVFKEVDEVGETNSQLIDIIEYLRSNPGSVALCDGSMATDIADDMANNMLQDDIWDRHQNNLQLYASMNQEFNIKNILMTPKDLDMCKERLEKKKLIFNQDIEEIENMEHLRKTAFILRDFDDNTLTTNISFYNIEIDRNDSMLQIHKKILEITKV